MQREQAGRKGREERRQEEGRCPGRVAAVTARRDRARGDAEAPARRTTGGYLNNSAEKKAVRSAVP